MCAQNGVCRVRQDLLFRPAGTFEVKCINHRRLSRYQDIINAMQSFCVYCATRKSVRNYSYLNNTDTKTGTLEERKSAGDPPGFQSAILT